MKGTGGTGPLSQITGSGLTNLTHDPLTYFHLSQVCLTKWRTALLLCTHRVCFADCKRVLQHAAGEHHLPQPTSCHPHPARPLRPNAAGKLRPAQSRLCRLQFRRVGGRRRPLFGAAKMRLCDARPAAVRHAAMSRRHHLLLGSRSRMPSRYRVLIVMSGLAPQTSPG